MVLGIVLLNKYGIGLWLAAIVTGSLMTPNGGVFRRPGPWIALGIGALLFLPHVAWQVQNGFPTLEFIRNARAHKIASGSPLGFVAAQVARTDCDLCMPGERELPVYLCKGLRESLDTVWERAKRFR